MRDGLDDVLGIGNAIVDVQARADEAFLEREELAKGGMTLIDAERAERLYSHMGAATEISGGSAANTVAGLASLGGAARFIGKVRDDQLGEIFGHDIRASGVAFDTSATRAGASTARSFILVTPDAQRTMATYLGACTELGPDDVDPAAVAAARVTYLEGYLWDPPHAKEAFRKAAQVAREAGRRVALTLSDSMCVERFRDEFLELVEGRVDVLFANEAELCSLYQTESFDEAIGAVRGRCEIAAVTRSEKGCVIVTADAVHAIDAVPVERVVDTTGAGDLFASGFLYGFTHDWPLDACARLGGRCAAEIISHYGARPERSLAPLLEGQPAARSRRDRPA